MKRFISIGYFGSSLVDYSIPKVSYDKSLTDRSHFVPSSEAIKRLSTMGALTASEVSQCYDFKDGRDNGMKVPVTRSKGVDIAELSQDIACAQKKLDKDIKDGLRDVASQKRINEIVQSHQIASSVRSESNGGSNE